MTDSPKKKIRILYAEDVYLNQLLMIEVLESRGIQLDIAINGQETLRAIESGRYDLVLMDVQMPEIDGLEVTRQVRKKEKSAGGHLPIIAVTAYAMKDDRSRCMAAGMDDYVTKPVEEEVLLAAIDRLLPAFSYADE